MERPLFICLTPVRNEAWILNAFLETTSLWADYIIIADQDSKDGSREIALSYPKVILIDNSNTDFNEAERQALLINRAREIKGDKILFTLDADEIFSANFSKTKDWQKILTSKPGDVFCFRWANLCPDLQHYWPSENYFPWMFHDDGIETHSNYVRNMHSMRIPYPIEEKQMFYVNEFSVLHFAYILPERVAAKMRFYKFIDFQMNNRNIIALSRSYTSDSHIQNISAIPREYINFTINIFSHITFSDQLFWFDTYIIEHLNSVQNKELCKLDIWEEPLLSQIRMYDHRTFLIRLMHLYLRKTKNIANNRNIKYFDKLLKTLIPINHKKIFCV